MPCLLIVYAVTLLSLPGVAFAAERARVALPQTGSLTVECVVDAARASGLPLAALIGVLAAENGKPGEALRNDNGTFDLGIFQINTCHVNDLAAMGIAPETILRDGCVNAYAAAWLLRKEYIRTGDIWYAIGSYHSRTPHRRDAYIARVRSHLARLSRTGIFTLSSLAPAVTFEGEGGR